jgi:hypothetical protein
VRVRRPRLVPIVFGLALAWLLVVVVLIDHEPDQGAPTPDRLASGYQRALDTHDSGLLGRLAPGVPVPTCSAAQVSPVQVGNATWIEVDNGAGNLCERLPTGRTHGWWIIKASP